MLFLLPLVSAGPMDRDCETISDEDANAINALINPVFLNWLKTELKANKIADLTVPTLPYVKKKIEARKPKEPATSANWFQRCEGSTVPSQRKSEKELRRCSQRRARLNCLPVPKLKAGTVTAMKSKQILFWRRANERPNKFI